MDSTTSEPAVPPPVGITYQWRKWARNSSHHKSDSGGLLYTDDIDEDVLQHMTLPRVPPKVSLLDEEGEDEECDPKNFPQQLAALRQRAQQQLRYSEDSMDQAAFPPQQASFVCDGIFLPPPVLRREEKDISCSRWQQSQQQSQPQLQQYPLYHREASVRSCKSLGPSSQSLSSSSSHSAKSAGSLPSPRSPLILPPRRGRRYRQPIPRTRSRKAGAV